MFNIPFVLPQQLCSATSVRQFTSLRQNNTCYRILWMSGEPDEERFCFVHTCVLDRAGRLTAKTLSRCKSRTEKCVKLTHLRPTRFLNLSRNSLRGFTLWWLRKKVYLYNVNRFTSTFIDKGFAKKIKSVKYHHHPTYWPSMKERRFPSPSINRELWRIKYPPSCISKADAFSHQLLFNWTFAVQFQNSLGEVTVWDSFWFSSTGSWNQ